MWKRKVYRLRKEEPATWEEYKAIVRGCRETSRKAKASLELNLARGVKGNRGGFFKYTADKMNNRGNAGPLMSEVRALMTEDTEKIITEYLLCVRESAFCSQAWAVPDVKGLSVPAGRV